MANSSYKVYAPQCALPYCINLVAYHYQKKLNEYYFYKWKSFCEEHRTTVTGRISRNIFLNSRGGCENRDGRLGWICGDPGTPSLTIDHWDGNRYNGDDSNIVILCANCHNEKTKIFKNNLTRYSYKRNMFSDLFE